MSIAVKKQRGMDEDEELNIYNKSENNKSAAKSDTSAGK